jgi:hypothetical protein
MTFGIMTFSIMSECCYSECEKEFLYAECPYAECRFTQCHGAYQFQAMKWENNVFLVVVLRSFNEANDFYSTKLNEIFFRLKKRF